MCEDVRQIFSDCGHDEAALLPDDGQDPVLLLLMNVALCELCVGCTRCDHLEKVTQPQQVRSLGS